MLRDEERALPGRHAGAPRRLLRGRAETNSFLIGDTPFGLDFEPGHWPGPLAGRAFVATHGAAGS